MRWSAFLLLLLVSGDLLVGSVIGARVGNSALENADFDYEDDDFGEYEEEVEAPSSARELSNKKKPEPVPAPPIPLQQRVIPVAIQPVTYTSVERKLSCPPGYDLRDEQCVTNDLLPPAVRCPPGHEQQPDGRCLTYTRARMDCPPDFQLTGGRCTAVEILPVQFTCPDGTLDETGLGCRVVEAIGPQCPPGYKFENDVCVQRFPASLRCPDGTVAEKHGCVKSVEVDAQMLCPPGSEMDPSGTTCHKTMHQAAKCPKGFKMSQSTGKCVKKVKKILAPCHPGFTPVDSHSLMCEKKLEIPPELSCPVEARLDPVTGQCITEMATGSTCPEGFVKSRSLPEMCEKIVEEVGVCPPGTTPVGFGDALRCQTVVELDMIECCPPGFEQIYGKCERREFLAPIPPCEDCVRVRTVPVTHVCPPDFVLSGQRCIRHVTEPCGEELPPPPPPAVNCAVYQRLLSSVSLRSLSAVDPASFIPPECLKPAPIPVAVPKLCHREEAVPAQLSCPTGTEFTGTGCAERYEIEKVPKCPIGTLDASTGQCVKVVTVPLKMECVPGTTRIGNRCVQYEDHPPQFNCPPDAVKDRGTGSCVMRLPSIPGPVDVFRSSPAVLCPSGSLNDNVCWDIERIPRHYVCPEGSVPDKSIEGDNDKGVHYCLTFADFIIPPPTKKTIKPLFFCSDGKQTNGKRCSSQDFSPMTPVCPPGSVLEDRSCVRTMKPVGALPRITAAVAVPVCPAGTVVQGTKCVATKEVPPHIICPPGFIRSGITGNNRECAKETDTVAFCPPGTVHTPEGCLLPKSIPPLVTHKAINDCEAPDRCY